MPDEDMEITTDLGPHGFGEDIDIDIDFPIAQPDEDMELGDYDQAQDIPNFNTDTRDELMAEGDDASYGMIDADDIDHNEAAAAANDIGIDIGDTDENLWQHDSTRDEAFRNTSEIDYAEDADTGADNMNTEALAPGDSNWQESSMNLLADSVAQVQDESVYQDPNATNVANGGLLPLASTDVARGDGSQDFGVSQHGEDAAEASGIIGTEASASSGQQEQLGQTAEGTAEIPESGSPDSHQAKGTDELPSIRDTSPTHEMPKSGNQAEEQAVHHHDEVGETEYDDTDGDIATAKAEELDPTVPLEQDLVDGEDAEPQEHDGQDGATTDYNAPEDSAGASYPELTNDQTPLDESSSTDQLRDAKAPGSPAARLEPEVEDLHPSPPAGQQGAGSAAGNSPVEAATSIAIRHEMYISYGQTDYKLFAKSEDDDTNQYFLSDMSALDLPLSQFMSSLRDVVSEEISPLDELVLHVDGLGLEFSESTANDFLTKYTFGDVLRLYERLVKNDAAESSPDLYTFLMVKPNCNQRLVALLDSANAGRGLSEIAVYRESTPFEDELEDELESESASQHPDISLNGEGVDEVYHLLEGVDEGADEEADEEAGEEADEEADENAAENADAFDTTTGANNTAGTDHHRSHTSVEDAPADADTFQGEAAQLDGNTKGGGDNPHADDLIDFSDEELDIPSSTQDQPANESLQNHALTVQEPQNGPDTTEACNMNQQAPPAMAGTVAGDFLNSDNTSATATLNGDDQDEIDYSDDDEANGGTNDASPSKHGSGASGSLKLPVDDEITWESENEDAKKESMTTSKQTVQVSPSSATFGKRTRDDADGSDGAGEENDNKRRRS